MTSAQGSAAPIGDMMMVVGNAILGPGNGRTFMLIEAFTVFLAIIGTTLSCMNTGARVTYAMGKDEEVPEHFGLLHSENLTPHRAIWTLAAISAVVGVVAVLVPFGDSGALQDSAIKALPQGLFSSVGYMSHDAMAALPNTLLTVTLASNFGTFLLYMLSCFICIVAYHKHPNYSFLRHMADPGIRAGRQPGLHGVLPDRTLHGIRHGERAAAGPGNRAGLGSLWRHLLHALQQAEGADDAGGRARDGGNAVTHHT